MRRLESNKINKCPGRALREEKKKGQGKGMQCQAKGDRERGGMSTKWCESDLYFNSKMNYLAHFLIPLRLRVFTLLRWQRADPSEILITFYSLLFTSL